MGDIGSWFDGISVVGALLLIGVVVFAESGLLIGAFLPGDTLLFTVGFFAAQGRFPLGWVMFVIFLGAVMGDNAGYFFGNKTGPRMFRNTTGIFFRQENIEKARRFYERHGGKTVLFARFVPYARTFAPIIAGAAGMRRWKFILFNLVGALLWTVVLVLGGYWLGIELASKIESYLLPVSLVALFFAFSPSIVYLLRNRQKAKAIWQEFKDLFGPQK